MCPSVDGSAGRQVAGVKIKELPQDERPRERLLAHGPGTLSSAELLAILIGTGNSASADSALDLARRLLRWAHHRDAGDDSGGVGEAFRALAVAGPEELCEVPGIGAAKAARVVAAIELGRRLASVASRRRSIRRPADVVGLMHEEMRHLKRECLRAVMLDTKRHILAVDTVSVGGLDSTVVHPREVFRAAIQRSASAVILVHNHPSGDPTPSPDDFEVTRRLIETGRVIGIEILDHVVIGDRRYASIRDMHEEWFA